MSKTAITWIMFILPIALGLFYVKHIVQNLEEEITQLERSIEADEEEVHVLRAEWAYLSRPERIKNLAGNYLDIEPTTSAQIADVKVIPHASNERTQIVSSTY